MKSQEKPEETAYLAARIADHTPALRSLYAQEITALKQKGERRKKYRLLAKLGGLTLGLGLLCFHFAWRTLDAEGFRPLSLELADGSKIFLDAGGVVQIPLAPWRRDATLLKGDALFDIIHDSQRPFVVYAGESRMTDLGTRFIVQHRQEGLRVAVFEGVVELAHLNGQSLEMKAGQAAFRGQFTTMPDEEVVTAWRQGRLIFRNTSLQEVVEKLSRYRTKPIVLANPNLASLKLSGSFALGDSDAVLQNLDRILPIEVVDYKDKTIIQPRALKKNPNPR